MVVEVNVFLDHPCQFFIGLRNIEEFQTLGFEMAEEVLAARIVVAVGLPGMGYGYSMLIEIPDIGDIRILESLIGMKDALPCRIPFIVYDLTDVVHHQLQIVKAGDLIGYNGIVIEVLDHGKIHAAFLTVDVTDICH